MSDGCGGDAEMMEGKDISRDLEYHIARADRNYLKDGIHRAVITTPGCYMVTTVERAEKTIGDTLYRTDSAVLIYYRVKENNLGLPQISLFTM